MSNSSSYSYNRQVKANEILYQLEKEGKFAYFENYADAVIGAFSNGLNTKNITEVIVHNGKIINNELKNNELEENK